MVQYCSIGLNIADMTEFCLMLLNMGSTPKTYGNPSSRWKPIQGMNTDLYWTVGICSMHSKSAKNIY